MRNLYVISLETKTLKEICVSNIFILEINSGISFEILYFVVGIVLEKDFCCSC